MPPGFDLHAAEDRMRLPLGGGRQLVVIKREQPLGLLWRATQTTLQRSPGRGTNTHGPCGVWNSVETLWCGRAWADVEGQRRLVERAPADRDAGGLAAQRMPAVGADHEPRGERLA